MCIAFIAYRHMPELPLVVAANRDEFYQRPTSPMDFWEDHPGLLAGRDLEAKGTWLGATRKGRIAFLTNYHEPGKGETGAASRGQLVSRFLTGVDSVASFGSSLEAEGQAFNGFNLIYGTLESLYYYSNREGGVRPLDPGIHGLSNHMLNTPWPKVTYGKQFLADLGQNPQSWHHEALFRLLASQGKAADHQLPATEIGLPVERILSSVFIRTPSYGSRCGTVLSIHSDGKVEVQERTYQQSPDHYETRTFQYTIDDSH